MNISGSTFYWLVYHFVLEGPELRSSLLQKYNKQFQGRFIDPRFPEEPEAPKAVSLKQSIRRPTLSLLLVISSAAELCNRAGPFLPLSPSPPLPGFKAEA